MLLQNTIEDGYPADLAQLDYSIYSYETGLVTKGSGLSNLMEVIIKCLVFKFSWHNSENKISP